MAWRLTARGVRRPLACGVFGAFLCPLAGCVGENQAPLLKLTDDGPKPIQLGVVADRRSELLENPLELFLPFQPFEPLRAALSQELARPVNFGLCFLFTADEYLCDGLFDVAVLSPLQYAHMAQRERFPVLALSRDERGRTAAAGLLVAAAGGDIRSTADLRGKVVAFGPPRDARTHGAALLLLADRGIRPADLSPQLLPVPGALKTFSRPQDVLRSVRDGDSHAGWIDEGYWDELPEAAGEAGGPSRAGLRILDRTIALPELLVVGSLRLDAPTRRRIEGFLYTLDSKQPEALRPLRLSGFEPPSDEVLKACSLLTDVAAAPGGL
jgi:ABC-type phosphate/phosphonate transport system substrate-binding protein